MDLSQFKAIIDDIESQMEGEGYFIHLHLKNGHRLEGGWSWLITEQFREVLLIDDNTTTPAYVPLMEVSHIRLSDR